MFAIKMERTADLSEKVVVEFSCRERQGGKHMAAARSNTGNEDRKISGNGL